MSLCAVTLNSESAALTAITSAGGILAFQPVVRKLLEFAAKIGARARQRTTARCARIATNVALVLVAVVYAALAIAASVVAGAYPAERAGCASAVQFGARVRVF